MSIRLEVKRILIFILIAYGVAWCVAGLIYWLGGMAESPTLIPGLRLSLAVVLIALFYMPAPALAHVATRWLTGEGWQIPLLRLRWKQSWRYVSLAWFVVPLLATIFGSGLFFLIFPQYFDPSMSAIRQLVEESAPGTQLPPPNVMVTASIVQGILLGGIINAPFTFGEEFGWRGYLQQKLTPLGWRKAMVLMGLIWGLWHAPIIAMGHNYGTDYAGYPWTGIAAMVWFCITVGTFLGWATLQSGSLWPAVFGHAAINAISGLGGLFVSGQPNPLLGPLPTAMLAGIGWTLIAILLLRKQPKNLKLNEEAGE